MKKIVEYQCEICNKRYSDKDNAELCESKGYFDVSAYPIGLMFEYSNNDFIGIFSLAQVWQWDTDKHLGHYSSWACRTIKYPPNSLGEERCSGNFIHSDKEGLQNFIKYHRITKEKIGCDEFNRMVSYLKSVNIVPQYYNEQGQLIQIA